MRGKLVCLESRFLLSEQRFQSKKRLTLPLSRQRACIASRLSGGYVLLKLGDEVG